MLRDGQSKVMENMGKMNPLTSMPGFDAMRTQQELFMKAMTGGMAGNWSAPEKDATPAAETTGEDLGEIKKQLADLQEKLAKLD